MEKIEQLEIGNPASSITTIWIWYLWSLEHTHKLLDHYTIETQRDSILLTYLITIYYFVFRRQRHCSL